MRWIRLQIQARHPIEYSTNPRRLFRQGFPHNLSMADRREPQDILSKSHDGCKAPMATQIPPPMATSNSPT